MQTSFISYALRALLPATLLLAACGKKDTPAPTPAPDQGSIQLVQAAPYNQVKMDLYANDAKIGDAEYGRPSGYASVATGARSIRVKANTNSADVFPGFAQTVDKDKRYTIYTYNSTANAVGYITTTDDQATPATGKANVRFVNLGFDANAVTLTYSGATATPIASNIAYAAASPFAERDANVYNLQVRELATGQSNTIAALTYKFEAGKNYTVLLRGRNSTSVPAADQLVLQVIVNN